MCLFKTLGSPLQFEAAASLDEHASEKVTPCVLERLSVHHKLVQKVKLLLYRPISCVELFEALLYEYFHLLVSQ